MIETTEIRYETTEKQVYNFPSKQMLFLPNYYRFCQFEMTN